MDRPFVTLRTTRWLIVIFGGTLVLLAVVAGAGSRTDILRQLVIDTLGERLDSEVQLESFSVDTFPAVHVTGTGLIIRHKGRRDVPPLVSVQSFTLDGGLFGLLSRPRRFRTVALSGLQINIPPGFKRDKGRTQSPQPQPDANPAPAHDDGGSPAAIVVDRLVADEATLSLIPRRADKQPRVFAVHRLTMEPLGRAEVMSFEATLINPIPRGLVHARGTFGPWQREDPGASALAGQYTFDQADLGTVKGIGGHLSSSGKFGGQLARIAVSGQTHTPDFRVTLTGNPVPLETTFDAVVDGTDGDTYLNAVAASFLNTSLTAQGAIVGAQGVKGRTVKVHVKIADGRIEDVLRLAVKSRAPAITGKLDLHTDLTLPAGPGEVMDRLRLAGEFDVGGAQFTNHEIQQKVSDMSERARGLDPAEHAQKVSSTLRGRFAVDKSVLTLRDVVFAMPGAHVQVAGSYGLASEALMFDGTVRMNATVSQAAGGGVKSALLKMIDPLFKRNGAGAVLPIRIRGSRDDPKVGLDFGRALSRK
jgi:hypothetical protein